MNRKGIFRKEALENKKQQWEGKALLLAGASPWLISLISLAFIIFICGFLYFCDYSRRIDVSGEVITLPHSVNIYAPQQGYITKTYVKVGDEIKKGEPIYAIDLSHTTSSGNVSAETKIALEKQVINLEAITKHLKQNRHVTAKNLRSQLRKYTESNKETRKLVESSRQGVESMRKGLKNYEEYLTRGLINKDQLTNQRSLFYQQQSSYQNLNSQAIQEELQVAKIESDLLTQIAEIDNQISQNEYQLNDLRRRMIESDAGETVIVSAKSDGVVESLSVTSGQMVSSGHSLAQILPVKDIKYYLLLWLPSSSLPYIKTGDAINIRYDAFPSEKFGQFPGTIDLISKLPASKQELGQYSMALTDPRGELTDNYYKVLVSIKRTDFSDKGKMMYLSHGLKARAIVFLEKRPLYQWMFTPFYNIKDSVTGPVDEK
jgi:membrane fusion protein